GGGRGVPVAAGGHEDGVAEGELACQSDQDRHSGDGGEDARGGGELVVAEGVESEGRGDGGQGDQRGAQEGAHARRASLAAQRPPGRSRGSTVSSARAASGAAEAET